MPKNEDPKSNDRSENEREPSDNPSTEPAEEPQPDSEGLVLAGEILPATLPVLPIRPRPFFPGIHIPLEITEDHLPIVEWALESGNGALGLVLVKDIEAADSISNLRSVGVACKILKAVKQESGSAHILIGCLERFYIQEASERQEGVFAHVEYQYGGENTVNQELKAYSMAIVSALKELMSVSPLQTEAIKLFLSRSSLEDPGRLADFAASLTMASGEELQEILETFDVLDRIDKTLVLLKNELEVSKLQQKITKQIEEKMSAQQREFFLREQLKAIKQELGLEKEGKDEELEKFQNR